VNPLPPGSIIGILGGGQLGRMLAQAAARLGYRVAIYDPEETSIAAEMAAIHVPYAWDNYVALNQFGEDIDVATFEWENIPLQCVHYVGATGVPQFPDASCLEVAQDRLVEKAFAASLGLTVPVHAEVNDAASLSAAVATVGTPAILKTATEGYDGKGQARITSPADAAAAWTAVGEQRAILEAQIDFLGEFSVIVVRGQDGEIRHWDVPENVHRGGILRESRLPPPPKWAYQIALATRQAESVAVALDYVGVMAVEFFATSDGPVFNEIAPRVHNSGHWTIEGAVTCQFENHIRAICGLPLGDTATRATPVVMRNLIGDDVSNRDKLLTDPTCKLHFYGKGAPRLGRKMGHATWVGTTPR
jgi:5-(carboxyamino)imidazole ribonucleotide synthase